MHPNLKCHFLQKANTLQDDYQSELLAVNVLSGFLNGKVGGFIIYLFIYLQPALDLISEKDSSKKRKNKQTNRLHSGKMDHLKPF